MFKKRMLAAGSLLACLLALQTSIGTVAASTGAEQALQCSAVGFGKAIVMRARYDSNKVGGRLFYISFRAEGSFGEGRKLTLVLAGTKVAKVKLQNMLGGDVGTELSLSDPYSPGVHAKRFRSDFPEIVRAGMTVALKSGARTVMSCRFEDR